MFFLVGESFPLASAPNGASATPSPRGSAPKTLVSSAYGCYCKLENTLNFCKK